MTCASNTSKFIENGKELGAIIYHTVLKIQQVLYCNSFCAPDFLFAFLKSSQSHLALWVFMALVHMVRPFQAKIVSSSSIRSYHVMTQIGSN